MRAEKNTKRERRRFSVLLCLILMLTMGITVKAASLEGGSFLTGVWSAASEDPASPSPSIKNGLRKENGKYYFYENGKMVRSRWRTINGHRYYFRKTGDACTESVRIRGKYYVFRLNGRLVQPKKPSFVTVNGNRFYVDTNGQARVGTLNISNRVYVTRGNGRILKPEKPRFVNVGGYTYYVNVKGQVSVGNVNINGRIYVFRMNGRLVKPAKPAFVTVGSNRFYVNSSGTAYTGWMVVNNRLFYADSSGALWRNRSYEGIRFASGGAAEDNTPARLKIRTMEVVSSITNSGMSQSQKLRACWNYVVSGRNFYYFSKYPNLNVRGWQKETALNMLETRSGNCYSFACAFAALAAEIGYSPSVICGRVAGSRDGSADGLTRHCWVSINGLYYDPEAQYAGWYPGVYGSGSYYIYHTIQKIVDFRNSV